MVNLPNLPQPDAESDAPNSSLAAGLDALKQEDYLSALAYFADVQQAQANTIDGIRAQMGMVLTYERHGQPDLAYNLCQELKLSTYPAVKDWANRALTSLLKRYPELNLLHQSCHQASPATTSTSTQSPNYSKPAFPSVGGISTLPTRMPDFTEDEVLTQPGETIAPTLPPGSVLRAQEASHPPSRAWKNAGRLPHGKSLGRVRRFKFRLMKLGTAVVAIWLLLGGAKLAKGWLADALGWLPFVNTTQWATVDITWSFLIGLGIVMGLSPWLTDWLLKGLYGWQPLEIATLTKQSPETLRVLNQLTRQKKVAMPKLGLLPTNAPLAFTYGYLPRNARIVVSQGLLDQLAPDEIATIYAAEVGHIVNGDFVVLSLLFLLLQIPYLLYWKSAALGDWLKEKMENPFQAGEPNERSIHNQRSQSVGRRQQLNRHQSSSPFLVFNWFMHGWLMVGVYSTALVSVLSYGFYWCLRLLTLELSRSRVSYSDRTAVELTGNPNGLIRALLKIAIGTATDIQAQEQTSHLLECLDILVPLSYRLSITLGSVPPSQSWETLLEWEQTNIYRHWLSAIHAQPLLGERLRLLASYAVHWSLEPELNFPKNIPSHADHFFQRLKLNPLRTLLGWIPYCVTLFLQGAPLWGLPLGYALGMLIWGTMWLLDLIGLREVGWMVGNPDVFKASLMVGFSLAVFLWINPFFPEIKPADTRIRSGEASTSHALSTIVNHADIILTMFADPFILPSSSQPVRLEGKLLGRRGIGNLLGQDLILKTTCGLIKLHHLFQFGPLLEIWMQKTYPETLIGQEVVAIGWLRRGATPWVDLESLRTGKKISHSSHAVWFTTLACITTLVASYIIVSPNR